MAKQTTRDAALRRLFGNAAEEEAQKPLLETPAAKEPKRTKLSKSRAGSGKSQAQKVKAESVTEKGGGEAVSAPVSRPAETRSVGLLGSWALHADRRYCRAHHAIRATRPGRGAPPGCCFERMTLAAPT